MRRLFFIAVCLAAVNAFAQSEIFDADDFVDPLEHAGHALFISRASIGAAAGYGDVFRPLHQNMGFLHISNTLYWHGLQATYKHTEIRGSDDWSQRKQPPSGFDFRPEDPIPNMPYTPPPIPTKVSADAPPPGPKDSLQFSWYHAFNPSAPMLRYSLKWGRQSIEPPPGQRNAEDEDLYYRVEVQTMIRVAGKSIFGDVDLSMITQQASRPIRPGIRQRSQENAFTYTARLPLLRVGRALVAPAITVGHVSGGGAISVANPSVDVVWSRGSDLNFHVSYSPYLRNIGDGWTTRSQIAVFADRVLYAKFFRAR